MTVRWGILGAGWISDRALAGAMTAAVGAELVAVGARDARRASAFAQAKGIPRSYGSYAEVLADPDVDAVYIALANDAHKPVTIAALEAGKHVLCEKPLALTAAEVDEMAAAAEHTGRLLVEASWYRWHPRVRLAQRLIAEGAIGAVRHVRAGFTFAGVAPGNYRLDPAMGGGALYDIGCYAVSAALWSFGTPPREVRAEMELGPTGVDLSTQATVVFDEGTADLRASVAEPGREWIVIAGDRGQMELTDQAFTSWIDQPSELVVSRRLRRTRRFPLPAEDPYRVMVEEMSSVIEGGTGWVLPVAESRLTAAVIDAAFTSARTGRPAAVL